MCGYGVDDVLFFGFTRYLYFVALIYNTGRTNVKFRYLLLILMLLI